MFILQVDDDLALELHTDYRADAFVDLVIENREYLAEFLQWATSDYSYREFEAFLKTTRVNYANESHIHTRILYKGEIVGSVGLFRRNILSKRAEIGYWLGKAYNGQGIMTRAVSALCDYAFTTLDYHSLVIRCSTRNPRSCAVAERLGFLYEGTHRHEEQVGEVYNDVKHYSMLESDWTPRLNQPDFVIRLDEHLTVRTIRYADDEALYQLVLANQEHLLPWLPFAQNPTLEGERSYIQMVKDKYAQNNGIEMVICWDGEIIGSCGYHFFNRLSDSTEIGYWLAKEHTGRGIMRRCVNKLVELAFTQLSLNRILIRCATENEASCQVAKKAGFTHEGIERDGGRSATQEYVDYNVFAIIKSDWQKKA